MDPLHVRLEGGEARSKLRVLKAATEEGAPRCLAILAVFVEARAGVVCDEVSVSVLVLDLDVNGRASGPVSSAILDHRDAGLPLRLTLQQLRAETLHFAPGAIVRTCENPSVVVRASAMLGAGSAPLVCTVGLHRRPTE